MLLVDKIIFEVKPMKERYVTSGLPLKGIYKLNFLMFFSLSLLPGHNSMSTSLNHLLCTGTTGPRTAGLLTTD